MSGEAGRLPAAGDRSLQGRRTGSRAGPRSSSRACSPHSRRSGPHAPTRDVPRLGSRVRVRRRPHALPRRAGCRSGSVRATRRANPTGASGVPCESTRRRRSGLPRCAGARHSMPRMLWRASSQVTARTWPESQFIEPIHHFRAPCGWCIFVVVRFERGDKGTGKCGPTLRRQPHRVLEQSSA